MPSVISTSGVPEFRDSDGEFLSNMPSHSQLHENASCGGVALSMTHPPMIPLSRRLVFADLCHPFLGTDMKYVEILEL